MQNKLYFKIIVWFLSSSFFLLTSYLIISILNPNSSNIDSMNFMLGMMKAMESTMGMSMNMENDYLLMNTISLISNITPSIIIIGILCGVIYKLRRRRLD